MSREHDVYGATLFVPRLTLGIQGLFVEVDFLPGDIPQEVILRRTFLEGTIMFYDGLTGQVTIASQRIEELGVHRGRLAQRLQIIYRRLFSQLAARDLVKDSVHTKLWAMIRIDFTGFPRPCLAYPASVHTKA